MYTYRITKIDNAEKRIDVYFKLFADGKRLAEDSVQINGNALANVPSDGRTDYIKEVIAEACKKYMVVEDVKVDVNALVGTEFGLNGVVYETKAERVVRVEAEQAAMASKVGTL